MSEPIDPPVSWRQLATVLAAMPDTYRKLLADHVDAGCGRCRTCTVPGTGTPGAAWPCAVHQLATLAQQIHDKPLRGRPS